MTSRSGSVDQKAGEPRQQDAVRREEMKAGSGAGLALRRALSFTLALSLSPSRSLALRSARGGTPHVSRPQLNT